MPETRTLYVVLSGNASQYKSVLNSAARDTRNFGDEVDNTGRRVDQLGNDLDRTSGRLRIALDLLAAFGPAAAPIGAVGGAALGGLAATAGLATVGILGLVAASQGVGDALKAVNEASLDPTVANVQKAEEAMNRLAPAAQDFVSSYQALRPTLDAIGEAGAQEFFPGLTRSLASVDQAAPGLERLMAEIGRAGGEGIGGLIEGAAGDREFLEYLTAEVPDAMSSLIDLTGTLSHGMSRLLMSLDPGNDALLDWTNAVADGFDRWASSPQGREDVAAFLDYARENGPAVADFFGSLVSTLAQIVQAAAPLGGPILTGLTAVLDVVGAIADSDLGTPILGAVGAYSALNRTLIITAALQRQVAGAAAATPGSIAARGGVAGMVSGVAAAGTAADRTSRSFGSLASSAGRIAGPMAGLALASSDVGDSFGLTNTATGALIGSFAGPWGAALGGAVGLMADATGAAGDLADVMGDLSDQLMNGTPGQIRAAAGAAQEQLEETRQTAALIGGIGGGGLLADLFGAGDEAADQIDAARIAAERLAMTAESTGDLGDALFGPLGGLSASARVATSDVEELSGALADVSGWLDRGQAMRGYNDSVGALSDSIRNGFGREDAENIDGVGRSILQVAETMKGRARVNFVADAVRQLQSLARDAGPEAQQRIRALIRQLAGVRGKRVRLSVDDGGARRSVAELRRGFNRLPKMVQTLVRANGADLSRKDIENLRQQFKLTPKQVKTLVTLNSKAARTGISEVDRLLTETGRTKVEPRVGLNASAAYSAIASLNAALSGIPDETVYVNVVRREKHAAGGPVGDLMRRFGPGGPVYGPGGPTDDRVPAMLSAGEYVLPAATVDYYGRDVMEQLRSRSLQRPGQFSPEYLGQVRSRSLPEPGRLGPAPPVEPGREYASRPYSAPVVVRPVVNLPAKMDFVLDDGTRLSGYVRGHAHAVAQGLDRAQLERDLATQRMEWP